MKIADLIVGDSCEITLVVKSATPRETRAKKPYLYLEFYDGTDTINGNYWDWTSGNVPAVNSILRVVGQVTEWQGRKQLTIKMMRTDDTKTLNDFTPASGADLSTIYKDAYALASEIMDDTLRELTLALLEELRPMWLQVPGAVSVHHDYIGGTLVHSLSTARIAMAIATEVPEANVDLCIAGGLLHDIGKLFTYRLNGVNIEMTSEGQLYEHSFMGAEFVGNFAEAHIDADDQYNNKKLEILRHIILSHHGKLEYGAAVTPKCIEAFIVSAADGVDASIEQVRKASKKASGRWTDRVFTLSNATQMTPAYVSEVFKRNDLPF